MNESKKNKRVAVITAGILPMPSVKGGAIETLLQYVLDANEKKKTVLYDVYSIYDAQAAGVGKKFRNTNFVYLTISRQLQWVWFTAMRVFKKLSFIKDPNFQYIYIRKVIRELRRQKYDLVIVESDNHFASNVLRRTSLPVVLYLHNDKLNSDTPRGRFVADNCREIWVVSEYIKARVLTSGADGAKVRVIRNGVDGSAILALDKKKVRSELRRKYGIGDKEYVFTFTGRLEREKGVDKLVKAFNEMESEAWLIIVGGSFYSSNKRTRFVRDLYQLSSNNKKILFTGYVSHNDLAEYLVASDCFVLPSQWQDPAPLSNLEAMFAGLHIISSEAGGIPEYLGATSAELLELGGGYEKRLSKAMDRVAKEGARAEVYDRYFSSEQYVKDFASTLDGVLDGR